MSMRDELALEDRAERYEQRRRYNACCTTFGSHHSACPNAPDPRDVREAEAIENEEEEES